MIDDKVKDDKRIELCTKSLLFADYYFEQKRNDLGMQLMLYVDNEAGKIQNDEMYEWVRDEYCRLLRTYFPRMK